MIDVKRSDCSYTAFFCEENIWQLTHMLIERGWAADDLRVLFFSNPMQSVLLSNQRAAHAGHDVVWDYHVVLRAWRDNDDNILDPDTCLSFPTRTINYLHKTFRGDQNIHPGLRTLVREIPADAYIAQFVSDRSHMVGVLPSSAFPRYPAIAPLPGTSAIDLAQYRDMTAVLDDGSIVMPVGEYAKRVTAKAR